MSVFIDQSIMRKVGVFFLESDIGILGDIGVICIL